MSSNLTWSLTICTYNRPHFLLETLGYVAKQTRLPAEVVVVDGSDNWDETLGKVRDAYPDLWGKIDLVYEPAKVRSLTYQRNQALDLAKSDIVFSLDDDIYLFPETADLILQIYEADPDEEIAMVGAFFSESAPGHEAAPEQGSDPVEPAGFLGKLKQRLEAQLSLDSHFVPYWAPVDRSDPPQEVQAFNVFAAGLINGGRTTFRRRYGVESRWSELLKYYATHEDSDFSYRMSRFGRLLTAPDAKLFHADGNERQYNRFRVNLIRVRNLMALHRSYSDNRARSVFRLLRSFLFFLGLYLLIDAAQKRFSFPVVRAYGYGILQIPVFMFYPFGDFRTWYLNLQEKMYRTR